MILKGNCLDTLKTLPDCSVDSIVTDPPYELGFMGKSWDNSGIAYSRDLWAECLRVLKPGGHLLAFSGSRTYHRMVVAIEDSGFEIRDQIMWLYGSGFPKSKNVALAIDKGEGHPNRGKAIPTASKYQASDVNETNKLTSNPVPPYEAKSEVAQQWEGWGTALKPAHEPIVVARKPLIGTVANNVLTYGTGALNIDGSRVGAADGFGGGAKGTSGFAAGYEGDGFVASTQGRWPANVIHDGSEEVLARFPETAPSRQGKPRGTAKKGLFANSEFNKVGTEHNDSGSAARFFKSTPIDEADTQSFIYRAKANKRERNAGLEGLPERHASEVTGRKVGSAGAKNSKYAGMTETPRANIHPTVKPVALMRYLIRLVTPPNGIVLDPFLGSGSTAVAAILEGFEWIGCEITEDYFPIIEARVEWAQNQPTTLL